MSRFLNKYGPFRQSEKDRESNQSMTVPVSNSGEARADVRAAAAVADAPMAPEAVIPLWVRQDLVAMPVFAQGEPGWSVKDPVSLSYFRLLEPEYAILKLLDGSRTCSQLVDELRRRFPWEEWDCETVLFFLKHLESSGLVINRQPGTGARQARRSALHRRNKRVASLTSFLAVRFRGIDPRRLLGHLYPLARPLFTKTGRRIQLAVVAIAALLVVLRFDEILHRLPALQSFVGPQNLLSLMLAIVVIKLLHELGHALTCHHFGGECHELGVMLLVFLPVLYCDVSDAWMLPSRRARMAISAAGIVVELMLASLFVFLWWWSVPGWLNSFCLNAIIICSLNTVFFNGNPLLKYDGYYVLSDLVGIPNLRSQSRHAVQQQFEKIVLGTSVEDDPLSTPRDWFLVVYGVASISYQLVVISAILWFITETFDAWHIGIVGRILAIPVLAGVIVFPCLKLILRARMHLKNPESHRRRAVVGLMILAVGLILALAVPIPNTVKAPFVVNPGRAQAVYVTVSGRIESAVSAGTRVSEGDALGTLVNRPLQLEREKLAARAEQLKLTLSNLKDEQGSGSGAALQIPATRDALLSAQEQLAELDREVGQLVINSPATGVVLAPPNLPASLSSRLNVENSATAQWSGTPLDPQNSGAFLQQRTLFCYVGDSDDVEATLVVDQSMIEFVSVGQLVELTLQSAPGRSLHGTIDEIALADIAEIPREILVAGFAPTPQKIGAYSTNTEDVAYQIRIRLEKPDFPISLYSPGRASIDCGWRSAGELLWRQFRQTFSTL